ncbi:hypothetical protein SAMN05660976_03453 [Nonomuraea pusilla]|uniref:DUF4328 domain-containing protein n=2 Tax=Nonomuraea pusilla TaxID=46177 RepID=A0A1H7TDH5_9ACTN|nr:hypothetical protein SAMN05660976_03453 [Nonomuraea pusilla]
MHSLCIQIEHTNSVYYWYTRGMRIIIKTVGTACVIALLSYPFWAPQWGSGILGEIAGLGTIGALIVVAVFFLIVALYCRALQTTMTLVRPEARSAAPASVWWMFAIPFNFTEDFFIVHTVSSSMTADARMPSAFMRWWAPLGYGWCVFQIVSLFPGITGFIGGAIAIPLWAAHWIMTVRANRMLAAWRTAVPITSSL